MNQNLIIIDDDEPFRERLARSMEKRGFIVETFGSANKAKECLKENFFTHAIVDMRLEEGSGLEIIQYILKIRRSLMIIIIT